MVDLLFTSHYVSINSRKQEIDSYKGIKFTSHYVSINSLAVPFLQLRCLHLHPTMYLLIQNENFVLMSIQQYLHPTMYLLIQRSAYIQPARLRLFTSHYVSINSRNSRETILATVYNLHPTMYLLIPQCYALLNNPCANLHPTMYLLIQCVY